MLNLGIDDAGRGPVIGPMAIAGCLLKKEAEDELKKLGVKDSKELTEKRRQFLAEIIKKKADAWKVVLVPPSEIDGEDSRDNNLNTTEALKFAEIINQINFKFKQEKIKVIADCPSVNISRWRDLLKTKIEHLSNLEIACEHKADKNHISVSAASILAKCEREKEMKKLKEKYGEHIGSGYTSDALTIKFLEKYFEIYKDHGIFRKSWGTYKKAVLEKYQTKLF